MAKQGKTCSWPIKFFCIIVPNIPPELPTQFVKMQGKNMPKHVTFKVPTGNENKIELKIHEGRAWLDKGCQEFVDKFSIQSGYHYLNLQYHGKSRFEVIIFDESCTEIRYPFHSSSNRGNIEHIEDDGDEECPQRVKKDKGVKKNERQPRNHTTCHASERVLAKANSFKSSHPHFTIMMTPTYVCGTYLYIPIGLAKKYFLPSENRSIILHYSGGTWPMKCTVVESPFWVKISSGWTKFVRDNELRVGDVCAFELVKKTSMEFDVTIFRIADEEEKTKERKKAKKRLLETIRSFKGDHQKFTICLDSSSISGASVHVPTAHAQRYLKRNEHGEDAITVYGRDGRSWKMEYERRHGHPDSHPHKIVLRNGWVEFVRGNLLKEGDFAVFERVKGEAKAYKANIFRVD